MTKTKTDRDRNRNGLGTDAERDLPRIIKVIVSSEVIQRNRHLPGWSNPNRSRSSWSS
jgi:hypothetical protein